MEIWATERTTLGIDVKHGIVRQKEAINAVGRVIVRKGLVNVIYPILAALRWPPSLHFTKLYPLCPSGWSSVTKSSGNLSQSCRLRIFLYAESTTPFEVRSSRTQKNNRNPSNITNLSDCLRSLKPDHRNAYALLENSEAVCFPILSASLFLFVAFSG